MLKMSENLRPRYSFGEALDERAVGEVFEGVVDGFEPLEIGILVEKGKHNQMIGQGRVLGQKASMGIGTEGVLVNSPFKAVPAVVAEAFDYLSKRLHAFAEVSLAPMVLKAYDVTVIILSL